MMRPSASTNTCSARLITACITCSIITMVMPRVADRLDHRHHVAHLGRVEAGQHLVEQQQLRLDRERARELQPLAARDREARRRGWSSIGAQADLVRDLLGGGERIGAARRDADARRPRCSRARSARRMAARSGRCARCRAAPADAAARPVMSAPRRTRGLRSALRKPVMIANSVVLPAPFGPISAVMRPSSAMNEALVDGEQPAEAARHVLDASSICAAHAARALEQPGDAARREGHHEDQHAAVDHEIEPRRVADQVLGDLAERLAPPARRAAGRTPCRCRR